MLKKFSLFHFVLFFCLMAIPQISWGEVKDYQTGMIQDIQSDGTVVLSDGQKILIPKKALKNPELKIDQEIVVYRKGGITHSDPEGRLLGWFLVLDLPRESENGLMLLEELKKAQTVPLEEKILQKAADSAVFDSLAMNQGYNAAAISTVAPPVGAGFRIMAENTMNLSPGGILYLQDGKKLRVGKNVVRDSSLKPGQRLVFCAV